MAARPYQVVVYGATGFVGNLVCERILQQYQGKLAWAAAARSRSKLESLKQKLIQQSPAAKDIPLIIADANDSQSLELMASQTSVVLGLTGPYAKYGSAAVAACVKEGAHWCDLTGESLWIKDMIHLHHDEAQRKQVKIVHCCGFDSIPADLGALYMGRHVQNTLGRQVRAHKTLFQISGGAGPSGGTLASIFALLDQPGADVKAASDPYFLNPSTSARGPDGPDDWNVHYSKTFRTWTAPSPFQVADNRIIRRSNALLGAFGSNYSCSEALIVPNLAAAIFAMMSLLAFAALASIGPIRRNVLQKVVTQPGSGPSRQAMLSSSWEARYETTTTGADGRPKIVTGRLKGQNDPGYWDTATMILECAICLATQDRDLQDAGCLRGGILTPASALGMILVQRLNKIGIVFSADTA